MSLLPVPYVQKALAEWRPPLALPGAPLADWGALVGIAVAAFTAAAVIAIIAVRTWT